MLRSSSEKMLLVIATLPVGERKQYCALPAWRTCPVASFVGPAASASGLTGGPDSMLCSREIATGHRHLRCKREAKVDPARPGRRAGLPVRLRARTGRERKNQTNRDRPAATERHFRS